LSRDVFASKKLTMGVPFPTTVIEGETLTGVKGYSRRHTFGDSLHASIPARVWFCPQLRLEIGEPN